LDIVVSIALNAAFLVSVVALVALGLGVIYGLLGVINMAHGEFVALGAYVAFVITSSGAPYWLALLLAPAVGMAAGMLLQGGLISRLVQRPLDAILVTLGLSLVFQQVFQAVFGPAGLTVPNPAPGTIVVLGATFPVFRVVVIGVSAAVIVATILFLARSEFGIVVRAILQNRDAASVNGVNTARYSLFAFGLGAALAAIAGALIAPSTNVVPYMGGTYLAPAFVAVILGGAGRPVGVLVGAAFMGGLEVALTSYIGPTTARATVLILAIIAIRLRPDGLLREAKDRFA
jgi:branched-chain amino acid transport system permease protein/urea transport system permease protein